jgi:hypothetical protein
LSDTFTFSDLVLRPAVRAVAVAVAPAAAALLLRDFVLRVFLLHEARGERILPPTRILLASPHRERPPVRHRQQRQIRVEHLLRGEQRDDRDDVEDGVRGVHRRDVGRGVEGDGRHRGHGEERPPEDCVREEVVVSGVKFKGVRVELKGVEARLLD